MTKISALLSTVCSLGLLTEGQAADCYKFEQSSQAASAGVTSQPEVWCYQNLDFPVGSTYIYNIDGEMVRPELAMVVEPDGLITHGSLLAGSLSVHSVQSRDFNPFTVPLKRPLATRASVGQDRFEDNVSAKEVLNLLLTTPAESRSLTLFADSVDDVGALTGTAAVLPFRGYWWAYKGAPLAGTSSSPLAKYDRYVKARTGVSPGAQSWELANHRYHGVSWEGHCNGWAASSVLRPEPNAPRTDPMSGVTFSVSDQKGILAEVDYCAKVAFFGSRYRGGGDRRDIYPAKFHNTLRYYIGNLRKPIAVDYRSGTSVDNHVISKYSMTMQKTGTRTYTVTTVATIHKYDSSRINTPGIAPTYKKTYRYTLTVDANGAATGGSWLSENPDFLWVPLSPMDCSSNNPRVSEEWMQRIVYQ